MKNPEIPSDDMRVIGLDTDGCVVCEDHGERYNTGDTPEQFGLDAMTPEELKAIGRGVKK